MHDFFFFFSKKKQRELWNIYCAFDKKDKKSVLANEA